MAVGQPEVTASVPWKTYRPANRGDGVRRFTKPERRKSILDSGKTSHDWLSRDLSRA
jgi:hypothetical protein